MKVNGLATKGKVLDNPFGGKAVTAYCARLAVYLFHKVTLIQPEVYLGNALLDIYHIKIICEYLWKDTTQQLLGLHDAKITNTYEIMCMRGRGCNWVLRLTRIICIRLNGYNLSQNQQVQHPSFCSNERLSAAKIYIIINISHTERLIMIILGLIFIKPNILKTNIT